MAKKKYDVTERMQEVARRAREQQRTPASTQKPVRPMRATPKSDYDTRPGASMIPPAYRKDVNLAFPGPSASVLDSIRRDKKRHAR